MKMDPQASALSSIASLGSRARKHLQGHRREYPKGSLYKAQDHTNRRALIYELVS